MAEAAISPETKPAGRSSRRAGYSSPSIIARRHRILDETRQMIGEVGIANLSMDDVARRADVAKRTLYNAFQSKEHLVASAISQYFEAYTSKIRYTTEHDSLEWMLEHLVLVARRNIDIRNYTRALLNVYFSTEVDPEIRKAIYDIVAKSHEPWVRGLVANGDVQPWIDADDLIAMLARNRYATAHAWTEGQISDNEFVPAVVRGFFIPMAGATVGSVQAQILDLLEHLDDNPVMKAPLRRKKG
ncbi:MAG: TetR/AcrR family transcriptional regulator [Sphingomonadales bacterium]|nr:TetR/AcrR family transcriptional regulator [Sphingomonadales bacterium]